MKQKQINKFRITRADELKRLYNFLRKEFPGTTASFDSILEASNSLKKEAGESKSDTSWGYHISNLILPLDVSRHIRPNGISTLRVKIDCNIECKMENWETLNDPFTSYSFAFVIYGEKDGIKHSICWHFDRDSGDKSDEHHPLYHLQYSDGTNHLMMTDTNFDWGQAIYLDSPRIVHYPMDIILGIGFYLTNFCYKGKFGEFLNNSDFKRLYEQSKKQILKPYFLNLASHWDNAPRNPNWNDSKILCPHLC